MLWGRSPWHIMGCQAPGVAGEDEVMDLERSGGAGRVAAGKYRIRRIGLGPLGKFGCLLGGLVSCVPGLAVAWGGLLVVGGLRRLLEGWQRVEIQLLGQGFPIDVVSLLNLESLLTGVQQIDGLSWVLAILFVALTCVSGGLVFLVMGILLSSLYNFIATLTGGLEVELEEPPPGRQAKR